jgi:hypothetical protein
MVEDNSQRASLVSWSLFVYVQLLMRFTGCGFCKWQQGSACTVPAGQRYREKWLSQKWAPMADKAPAMINFHVLTTRARRFQLSTVYSQSNATKLPTPKNARRMYIPPKVSACLTAPPVFDAWTCRTCTGRRARCRWRCDLRRRSRILCSQNSPSSPPNLWAQAPRPWQPQFLKHRYRMADPHTI